MFTSPRIVVIDDRSDHLEALANGLYEQGLSCLPIHYPDDASRLKQFPNLRVLFADLHLMAGGDDAVHFSTIGGLIREDFKPLGPYFVVLWTEYPDKAGELMEYLESRLESVATPFDVLALDKSDYYDAQDNLNSAKLVEDIAGISERSPQFSVLLDWEDHVLGAAGDTIGSILELAKSSTDKEARRAHVSRLLYNLAVAGVGPHYFENDRFGAVNGALLPVLADRMSFLELKCMKDAWQTAFDPEEHKQKIPPFEVAKLNRLVHIAFPSKDTQGDERGAVIELPERYKGEQFLKEFAIKEEEAASGEFYCRSFSLGAPGFRWVLVQSQPACDYALNRPGTLPFYLGIELPMGCKGNKGNPPDSLWISPSYERLGLEQLLHVSARFPVSISKQEASAIRPIYRLREQLLGNLSHYLHSYGSRLGIMSFR